MIWPAGGVTRPCGPLETEYPGAQLCEAHSTLRLGDTEHRAGVSLFPGLVNGRGCKLGEADIACKSICEGDGQKPGGQTPPHMT